MSSKIEIEITNRIKKIKSVVRTINNINTKINVIDENIVNIGNLIRQAGDNADLVLRLNERLNTLRNNKNKFIVSNEKNVREYNKLINKINVFIRRKSEKVANNPRKIAIIEGLKIQLDNAKRNANPIINNFVQNVAIQRAGAPVDFGRPQLIRQVQEDVLNFFHKIRYQYQGILTLEELYNKIEQERRALNDGRGVALQYVILYIIEQGRVRHISIAEGYLNNFQRFQTRVNDIINGNIAGSDAVNADENIDYNVFSLAFTEQLMGQGDASKILFNCVGIESGFCGYNCLEKCGFKYEGDKKDLYFLNNMIECIKKNNLSISIIANTFSVKNFNTIFDRNNEKIIDIIENKKNKSFVLKDIFIDDINIISLCGDYENSEYIIIYDDLNKHFDLVKDVLSFQEDVKLSTGGKIFKNDKMIFTPKEIMQNNINLKYDTKFEYVFFDYETVIDFEKSNCMQEYSISILNITDDELRILTDADNANNNIVINKLRKEKCKTFLGYDCSKQFINWILENQQNKIFCFVGFNNTNFDNFIFLKALLKMKDECNNEYNVSDIFYNGSQLLNFKINGRHHTFDIHKHLMGSLKANCESFKIKSCKKLDFDHNKAQSLYSEDKLIDFITNNNELKDYNEYDVLATAVLFCKYREALENIPATSTYCKNLTDVKTVGSLIYKVFEDHQKKKNFNLPKLSYQQYTDLQKYKIAGRVELFNGAKEVDERLVSTDVCSLYPFVMSILNCYYPCGDAIKEVKTYQGDDVIGFYYCDIDQSNLKDMNLPNIYAEKLPLENKWDSKNMLKDYLISNVMIGLLREFGCKVFIRDGFIFENKMKSCEMFGFLLDFMKAKNEQDTFKSLKDDKYNSALRETLKLLMNSLSGKVIEGLHTEKTVAVNSVVEFEGIKNKSEAINFINNIGDKLFITYEIDPEKLCAKQQRPIYLGVLIYDYAKRYMYQNSYSKVGLSNLLYTDTDASKFRYKHFVEWKQWIDKFNVQVPHWKEVEAYDERYKDHKIYMPNSKVFGSFEDELADMVGDEYKFYCIEKKSWLYAYKKDGKWCSKFRFKGLNGDALMLTLEEDFIKSKIVKHKATENKPAYEETVYYIEPYSEEIVYDFYTNNREISIENGNEIKFFKQIFETGEGYVLTQSFRKIVKNLSRNVDIEDEDKYNSLINNIQVNITMKHINIRK